MCTIIQYQRQLLLYKRINYIDKARFLLFLSYSSLISLWEKCDLFFCKKGMYYWNYSSTSIMYIFTNSSSIKEKGSMLCSRGYKVPRLAYIFTISCDVLSWYVNIIEMDGCCTRLLKWQFSSRLWTFTASLRMGSVSRTFVEWRRN